MSCKRQSSTRRIAEATGVAQRTVQRYLADILPKHHKAAWWFLEEDLERKVIEALLADKHKCAGQPRRRFAKDEREDLLVE